MQHRTRDGESVRSLRWSRALARDPWLKAGDEAAGLGLFMLGGRRWPIPGRNANSVSKSWHGAGGIRGAVGRRTGTSPRTRTLTLTTEDGFGSLLAAVSDGFSDDRRPSKNVLEQPKRARPWSYPSGGTVPFLGAGAGVGAKRFLIEHAV